MRKSHKARQFRLSRASHKMEPDITMITDSVSSMLAATQDVMHRLHHHHSRLVGSVLAVTQGVMHGGLANAVLCSFDLKK